MRYPKIVTVYKRDPETKYKTLLEGEFARPEFEYLKDLTWVWTEKIDGTNIRLSWDDQLRVEGRTDRAQIPAFLLKRLQDMVDFGRWQDAFTDDKGYFGDNVTLYGEGFGARIQKGGGNYIPDGVSFILFDVRVGDIWLKFEDVRDIGEKLDIRVVPLVDYGTLYEAVEYVKQGFCSLIAEDGEFMAEGLVMKPTIDLFDRMGRRIITKIKYKDFPREG